MFRSVAVLIFLTVFTGFVGLGNEAIAQDAAQDKARIYSAKLATREAARMAGDKYENQETFEEIVNSAKDHILDDLQRHVTRTDSEKEIRKFLDQRLEHDFDRALGQIYHSFAIQETQLDLTSFKTEMRSAFDDVFKQNKSAFLSGRGQGGIIFNQARNQAVEVQRSRISLENYPSLEQVEELEKAGWPALEERKAREALKRTMQKAEPYLLDAVENDIDARINEIIDHVKAQLKRQKEAAAVSLPADLVTAQQLSTAWRNSVQKAIDEMATNKKPWQKVYPPFLLIVQRIKENASKEEQRRFRAYLGAESMALASPADIEGVIRSDLRAHATTEQSRSKIVEHFLPKARSLFVETYLRKAPETERMPLKNRIEQIYLPGLEDDLKKKTEKLLEDPFRIARNNIADRQYKQMFPKVKNGSWYLTDDDELIIQYVKVVDPKGRTVDIRQITECLFQTCPDLSVDVLAKIKPVDFDTGLLLDETKDNVRAGVRDRLEEASRAWDGQWDIYLAHHPYVKGVWSKDSKNLIKELIENPPAGPDFSLKAPEVFGAAKQDWVQYFVSLISYIWQKTYRVAIIWPQSRPLHDDNRYLDLFKYIKDSVQQDLNTDVGKALTVIEAARKAKEEEKRKAAEAAAREAKKEEERKAAEAAAREAKKEEERKAAEAAAREAKKEEERKAAEAASKPTGGGTTSTTSTGLPSNNGTSTNSSPGTGGPNSGFWAWIVSLWWLVLLLLLLVFLVIYLVIRSPKTAEPTDKTTAHVRSRINLQFLRSGRAITFLYLLVIVLIVAVTLLMFRISQLSALQMNASSEDVRLEKRGSDTYFYKLNDRYEIELRQGQGSDEAPTIRLKELPQ